jgi:hypothetical protein
MHRSRTLSSLALCLVLGAGVAGCGDDDGEDAAGAAGSVVTTTTQAGSGSGGATTTSEPATTTTTAATTAAEPREVALSYAGGVVTGGSSRVEVAAGEAVRLVVTSDVAEEVHVHGYDLEVALAPGQPTAIDLVGDLPGVWEVELHGSGDVLCELEVAA